MDAQQILEIAQKLIDFKVKFNLAIIIGIIGILIMIKKIDAKNRIPKDCYLVGVMVLGFLGGICAIPGHITLSTAVSYGVAHAGAASILYQSRRVFLPGKDNIFRQGK